MRSLPEVRDRMIEVLGHPDRLSFINARLVLRTGISLSNPEAEHTADDVARVVGALREMGYVLAAHPNR